MASHSPRVMILGADDCGLCQEAVALARQLQRTETFELEYRSIEFDSDLRGRYGLQIPVVFVDGQEICWGQVTEESLREAIEGARRSRSISRILSYFRWTPKQ